MMMPVGPDAPLLWLFRDKWWLLTEEEKQQVRDHWNARIKQLKEEKILG